MPRFRVSARMTISVYTDVDAATEKEARDEAADRMPLGLCHQCGTGSPGEEWVTSGELDGLPEIDGVTNMDPSPRSKRTARK